MNFKRELIIIFFLVLASCSANAPKDETIDFANEKYGFNFSYQKSFGEVNTNDLPDRWALVDSDKDTLLFIVGKAQSDNILSLGRSQALRDLYPEQALVKVEKEKLSEVLNSVRLDNINGRQWYSYGIKFPEKNVESIVSGTICKGNEVVFVLVSKPDEMSKNQKEYADILNSFLC